MTSRQNSVSDTNFYLIDLIAGKCREKSVSDTEFRVVG
jgi:hypothetical protein